MVVRYETNSADEGTVQAEATERMKLSHIFRRGSAMSFTDNKQEKELRSQSISEAERKSSFSNLQLRLRRKKTQVVSESGAEETAAARKLGELLFSLPAEILAQIITQLSVRDLYNLRVTARTFHQFLNANASTITKCCLSRQLSESTTLDVQRILYPLTSPPPDLSHLLRMIRRQRIVDRQIYHLLSFVQMKIYMARTDTRVLSVTDNRQRLIEAFQRPGWIVTHFLEAYRDIIIYEHPKHQSCNSLVTDTESCEACTSIARSIVSQYPDQDIMPAYHFYQILLQHLQISVRAPTAAGPIERRLRGWRKATDSEQNLAIFVFLGGVAEIRRVAMMQGSYGSRLQIVTDFILKSKEAVNVNAIAYGGGGDHQIPEQARSGIQNAKREDKTPRTSFRKPSSSTVPLTEGPSAVSTNDTTITTPTPTSDATRPLSSTSTSTSTTIPPRTMNLFDSLSPPFEHLTQNHIDSLPDPSTFFYETWKERISGLGSTPTPMLTTSSSPSPLAPTEEDIESPYPWLARVMAGTGVDFENPRAPETPLAFGASPL